MNLHSVQFRGGGVGDEDVFQTGAQISDDLRADSGGSRPNLIDRTRANDRPLPAESFPPRRAQECRRPRQRLVEP